MKSPAKIWVAFLVWSVLEFIALAVWVGGLLMILGGVIPAVFNEGMEVGGRILTRVFEGYNKLVVGAIVLMVLAVIWRVWVSATRQDSCETNMIGVGRTEMLLLTIMISICCLIILWLSPASVVLQKQAFEAIGETQKKEAYEAFFQVHSIVRVLYFSNLLLGVGLIVVKIKRWVGPVPLKV